jgi:hypothetical protein
MNVRSLEDKRKNAEDAGLEDEGPASIIVKRCRKNVIPKKMEAQDEGRHVTSWGPILQM